MTLRRDVEESISFIEVGWPMDCSSFSTATGKKLFASISKLREEKWNYAELNRATVEALGVLLRQIDELRDENQRLTDLLLEKESPKM